MQNGIAHNGLILLWRMREGSIYVREKPLYLTMLFCTCRYPHLWVPAFLFTLCKEKLMKRHLNTSYRLVWNHITGTLVVASELARSRGKRAGVAIALSLAAVTSVPALAADTVVQAGETVSGGTLTNHDNQIVLGTTNGMTISTGLELGPDSEENTGGQWIQNGGIAGNTTVTTNGRQVVLEGEQPVIRLFVTAGTEPERAGGEHHAE